MGTIIALALLWKGGQGLYTSLTNLSPKEMTLAECEQSKPSAAWLTLKDCQLDLADCAAKKSSSGVIEELYIPVHPVNTQADNPPVYVLFATKDRTLMNALNGMNQIRDEQQALTYVLQHHEEIFPKRTISGLVRFGIELDDKDKSKLQTMQMNLQRDFIIIDDGKQPEFIISALLFAGGLLIGFLLLRSGSSKPAAKKRA